LFCTNCGEGLKGGSTSEGRQPAKQDGGGKLAGVILGIIASIVMIAAGIDMASIRSIRGDTVAEAFYNAIGGGFIGLGVFCIALVWLLAVRRSG